jgi:NAD(P)-dependent dehydrogenase (short-subunit alcohol dehydrogenase family)
MTEAADAAGGRVLVVGGGQGIGLAVASAFEGRATSWTRSDGVDAADPASVRGALAQLLDAHGAPYALVHTVGDFVERPLLQTDTTDFRHLFESNVTAVFEVVRAVVPHMMAAGQGRVVLFAAAGADRQKAMLRAPVYFAAKAALIQLARSLALEAAPSGVTVNVVAPGLIDHEHSHRESQARMLPKVPLGRVGSCGDVVSMVRYLLAPEAAYVTGQVLTVDGGLQA